MTTTFAGLDYSINQPTIPNVGANFGGSGPYANYVLLKTVPANASRVNIDVENNSTSLIVVVRDDGRAAAAAPPTNASVFALAAASGSGGQGGAYQSNTDKCRLQIYGPSGQSPQVAVFIDMN